MRPGGRQRLPADTGGAEQRYNLLHPGRRETSSPPPPREESLRRQIEAAGRRDRGGEEWNRGEGGEEQEQTGALSEGRLS